MSCKLVTTALFLSLACPMAAFATTATSLDANGNIQFVFDEASSIKVAPAGSGAGGGACLAGTAGAIRYVPAAKTFEGCNGSTWSSLAGGVPAGAVQAFALTSCPSGWSAAPALAGRTIIGAGYGAGLTGRALYETGGEEKHTISINEMPTHNHGVTEYSGTEGNGDYYYAHVDASVNGPSSNGTTYAGGNQPHNNMQPYYALLYCIKN